MRRSLFMLGCLTMLLAGAFACSSDDKDSAASTAEAVEAAETNQSRVPASNPAAAAINTIAKARTLARTVNQPKLNLNTASSAQLATLPDVGTEMVSVFEGNRPFVSLSQFRREMAKHVDGAQLATYEKFLYVPIEVNESDAETLAQIPGVTASIAKTLADKRPFATNASFLIELAKHVSDPEARAGAAYLKRR